MKVDNEIADKWLRWMKAVHIPAVMSSGCFEKYQLVKLLQVDETDGLTYAAQYYTNTMMDYDKYTKDFAPQLRRQSMDEWGDKFIAFRSLMQVEQ